MDRDSKSCAKKLMTPWLAGILALILLSVVYLAFKGGKASPPPSPRLLNRPVATARVPATAPAPAPVRAATSYHQMVDMVRPAVVGISLPGAQPFLQAWSGPLGALTNPNMPGAGMLQALAGGQTQAWQPWTPPQPDATGQRRKDEFLQCPNCGIKVYQSPGIPWAGAVCPSCKTVMAHIIRETEVVGGPAAAFGQPQALQAAPQQPPALQAAPQAAGAIGTGVIVSRRGYVLTNHHLVAGQANVTITLFSPQGAQQLPATLEAASPADDLAILKVWGAPPALPVAVLGNSDAVNIGDTVLALGNPFGLAQSVTDGIISAKRRSISLDGRQYQDVLQTDAPINPGNAGGPLVNVQGEVIGINTASFAPMQTHTGLGFAIPINRAYAAFSAYLDQPPAAVPVALPAQRFGCIRAYPVAAPAAPALPAPAPSPSPAPNEDSPAWIGLEFQLMNDVLAEQLKVPFDRGILISQVFPNSPAASAGLERGDVIYRVDGRRINDETQLRLFLVDKKPGDKVNFMVFRGGQKLTFDLRMAGGSFQKAAAAMAPKTTDLLDGSEIEAGTADIVSLGLTVDKITPEVAFAYSLPAASQGVLIAGVEGLALAQGVKEGDVVVSVDGSPTPDLVSFFKALKQGSLVQGVDLGLMRQGNQVQVTILDNPTPVRQGV